MTSGPNSPRFSAREEKDAQKWVERMIHDPDRHRAGLKRWIAERPDRALLYDDLAQAVNRAARAGASLPRPAVTRDATRPTTQVAARRKVRVAVAFALLLLAVLGAIAFFLSAGRLAPIPIQPDESPLASNDRKAGIQRLTLADGTSVILDRDAAIKARYSGSQRTVLLIAGRARFSVVHDSLRPFVVETSGGSVTAIGTLFDVSLRHGLEVSLIEGVVDIAAAPGRGAPAATRTRLTAGRRWSSDPSAGKAPEVSAIDPGALLWSQQMRTFDDDSVDAILSAVNVSSVVKILLAEPSVGSQRVFADLDVTNAASVATALANQLGLVVDRSTPGVLILRRPK